MKVNGHFHSRTCLLFVRRVRAGPFLEEDTLLVISSWLMSILIADKVQV